LSREPSSLATLQLRIAELEEKNSQQRDMHKKYLRILEASEAVNRIIIKANDLDSMLDLVLGELLDVFSCDRAWLLYPCDPTVATYRVPMERTRPQWPGAEAKGIDIPLDPFSIKVFDLAEKSSGVVRIDSLENSSFLTEDIFELFHIRSQMFMAIRPRMGKPWLLGIHHCESAVTYHQDDFDLFKTLGNRISDGLSNLISWQNSKRLFENTEISIWNEDLSELYKALEKQRQSGIEDLRPYLADNGPLVQELLRKVKVVQVNEATLVLFEAQSEEDLLCAIDKIYGPDFIGVFIDLLCSIWAREPVFRSEVSFKTLKEKKIDTILSFRIPETIEGFHSIPVSIIDISDRKQLEQSLQKSEERLDKAVRGSSDGFWDWVNLKEEVIWWSPRLFEILGYKNWEFQPNAQTFLQLVHPEDRSSLENALQLHYRNRTPFDSEYRVQTKSGSYRWVRGRGLAQWDEQGRPVRMSGSIQDITDRKESYRALRLAMEKADQANRAKTEFMAVMSHEMRTPLNAILGMAELAKGSTHDPILSRYLSIINQSGNNLLTLITDILDLSYIETGRLVLEENRIKLEALTQEALDIHIHNADSKGVALSCRIDPEIPGFIRGDQKRLRQVLLNLLGNAIKFTEKGRVELHLSFLSPHKLLFSVVDTGIGIPEEKQKLIFSSFSQADSSNTRQHGGIGLGLAICKRLIEAMNGEIWLESAVGSGSTFYVSIPLSSDC
jgi:PAS domain S-box-containing protein